MAPLGLWMDVARAYQSKGMREQYVEVLQVITSDDIASYFGQTKEGKKDVEQFQLEAWCSLWEVERQQLVAQGLQGLNRDELRRELEALATNANDKGPWVDKLSRLDPYQESILPFMARGANEAAGGKFARARKEYLQAAAADKGGDKNVAGLLGVAYCNFHLGEYGQALNGYRLVLRKLGSRRCPPCVRLGMAYCHAKQKPPNLDLAAACFKRVVQLDPTNEEALVGLATLELNKGKQGSTREAARYLLEAYACNPHNAATQSRLGALLVNDDSRAAGETLIAASGANADTVQIKCESLYLLGAVKTAQGLAQEAYRHFTTAKASNKRETVAEYGLAQFFLRQGDPQNAVSSLEKFQRQAPESAEIMAALGILYAKLGADKAKALDKLEKAVAINPGSHMIQQVLGELLLAKDPARASEAYGRAIEMQKADPDHPGPNAYVLCNAGVACFLLRRLAPAMDLFEEATSVVDGKSALATILRFNVGRVAEEMGDFPKAVAAYQGILREFPAYVDALMRLATMALRQDDVEAAKEHCAAIFELQPDHLECLALTGYMSMQDKDYEGAKKIFERLKEASKEQKVRGVEAYADVSIGNIHLFSAPPKYKAGSVEEVDLELQARQRRHMKSALQSYKKVLAEAPSNVFAANGIGCALAGQDNMGAAHKVLTQVQEAAVLADTNGSKVPDSAVNLAHVYHASGNTKDAVRMYKAALRKGAKKEYDVEILAYIARALYEAGELAEAKRYMQKAVFADPANHVARFNLAFCMQNYAHQLVGKERPPSDLTRVRDFKAAEEQYINAIEMFRHLRDHVDLLVAPGAREKERKKRVEKIGIHVEYCEQQVTKVTAALPGEEAKEALARMQMQKDAADLRAIQLEKEAVARQARLAEERRRRERGEKAKANQARLEEMQKNWQVLPSVPKEKGGKKKAKGPAEGEEERAAGEEEGEEDAGGGDLGVFQIYGGVEEEVEEPGLGASDGDADAPPPGGAGGGTGLESSDEEEEAAAAAGGDAGGGGGGKRKGEAAAGAEDAEATAPRKRAKAAILEEDE